MDLFFFLACRPKSMTTQRVPRMIQLTLQLVIFCLSTEIVELDLSECRREGSITQERPDVVKNNGIHVVDSKEILQAVASRLSSYSTVRNGALLYAYCVLGAHNWNSYFR